MVAFPSKFVGAVLAALTVSTAALAQSYYDDQACRQFADAQVAPLRDQANSQAVGNTLLGAGLGAAIGAAVGGGRGAGIGAAPGRSSAPEWRSQHAECGWVPAAAIQRLLCAVHGLAEVSDPAICRTSAGLCTGAGLWADPGCAPQPSYPPPASTRLGNELFPPDRCSILIVPSGRDSKVALGTTPTSGCFTGSTSVSRSTIRARGC